MARAQVPVGRRAGSGAWGQAVSAPRPSVWEPPTNTTGWPTPSYRQAPVPSLIRAVRAGRATTGRALGAMATVRWSFWPSRVVVLVTEVGDDGQFVDQPEPESERPAPRVDHRVGQDHGARAGSRHDGAGGEGLLEALVDRGLLEHGTKVQRGAPGEVDEAGLGDRRRHAEVLGRGAVHHHQALDLAAEGPEPFRRPEDHPFGVLVGGGGGQHEHVRPARVGEEGGVERAALGPFVAPDQGQRAGRVHAPLLHGHSLRR